MCTNTDLYSASSEINKVKFFTDRQTNFLQTDRQIFYTVYECVCVCVFLSVKFSTFLLALGRDEKGSLLSTEKKAAVDKDRRPHSSILG